MLDIFNGILNNKKAGLKPAIGLYMQIRPNAGEGGSGMGEPDAAPDEGRQFLVFKEGQFTLALGIESLKRLYDAESLPPRTIGTRMLDLHEITGAEGEGGHGYWIEMEIGQSRYLMPVQEVEGIRELSLAVVMEYPRILRRPDTNYIKRMFFDGLRMIIELDSEALVGATEGIGPYQFDSRADDEDDGDGEAAVAEEDETSVGDSGFGKRMLLFEAGSRFWSLDLNRVVKIVNRDEIHSVPVAGRKAGGVVYYNDQAVPIVSPGELEECMLGDKPRTDDDFSVIILVETRKGILGFGGHRILQVAEKRQEGGESEYKPLIPGHDPVRKVHEVRTDKILEHLA
jgi:chemotaxis signal transduction protein